MKKIVAGILAHVDAGKTTLSEAMLFESGNLKSLGRVDNKNAFLDTSALEKERGITIFSKTARLDTDNTTIIMVDTPGHVDFSGEMERALSVLDVAILLINASDGVQSHTKLIWKLLKEKKIPVFIFVNKMDLPDTDKAKLLNNLKEELSNEIIDFENDNTEMFFEEVATGSDELFSCFMEQEKIDEKLISEAVRKRQVFPLYFGSALRLQGVKEFLQGFEKYAVEKNYSDKLAGIVYKITKDSYGKRETHIKLTGGLLRVKDSVNSEKINEIRLYSGNRYEAVQEIKAGEIAAITGVTELKAGDVFGDEKPLKQAFIQPVLNYAIIFPKEYDLLTMHKYLLEIEEEEPTLNVEYIEATREIYVHLMGEVQTEVLKNEMLRRYNVPIEFGEGKVLYKETIKNTVEGVGHFEPLRHYAEVHLLMEPLPKGSGLQFDTIVSENDLRVNFQQLILTHLKEKEHKGVLTRSPITDMKITLVSGRSHLKHTEGGDFRQATYRAVRQGLMQAESVLLEPFYNYEITVPHANVGRVLTDIERMCGSSTILNNDNGEVSIIGSAPVATLNGYAKELKAYTKGQGNLIVSPGGYEPCHNEEEVKLKRNYNPEADKFNTADSVFCSHGAGTIIPWYEVFNYMHLPLMEGDKKETKEVLVKRIHNSLSDISISTEEIDEIISKSGGTNVNGRKGSYKGISEALKERQRSVEKITPKSPVYKGTKIRDKYMLIDGYNVVHAWTDLSDIASANINSAAGRLMDIVSNYAAITGTNIILVFDAYKVPGHREEVSEYHNIKVVYTRHAETADHYIERYAHNNAGRYNITVVTSDGVEQVIIRGEGCLLMSSRDFKEEVERAENSILTFLKE